MVTITPPMNPRSTPSEASIVTITPPMRFSSIILLYHLKKLFEYHICIYEEMLNSPLNFFFIAILIFDWLTINLKGVLSIIPLMQ